jgi:hypothetical protein
MLSHLRGNIVAYLALVVALGGTSYAAVALPKDSVGASQIKAGAVRSGEVKNGSLKALDFKGGQVPSGPAGPQGATGPTYAKQSDGYAQTHPPAAQSYASEAAQLVLPTAGRVYAYGHARLDGYCSPGSVVVGLYLDDQPIPGTGRPLVDNTTTDLDFSGLTAVVPAGQHTVRVGFGCDSPAGVLGGTGSANLVVGGILIGS